MFTLCDLSIILPYLLTVTHKTVVPLTYHVSVRFPYNINIKNTSLKPMNANKEEERQFTPTEIKDNAAPFLKPRLTAEEKPFGENLIPLPKSKTPTPKPKTKGKSKNRVRTKSIFGRKGIKLRCVRVPSGGEKNVFPRRRRQSSGKRQLGTESVIVMRKSELDRGGEANNTTTEYRLLICYLNCCNNLHQNLLATSLYITCTQITTTITTYCPRSYCFLR
ncbi:hypothetical protein MKX01_039850 [Papaver californicum]|nr:hypothetical protein MKX01_039850 [Papaver californicum]